MKVHASMTNVHASMTTVNYLLSNTDVRLACSGPLLSVVLIISICRPLQIKFIMVPLETNNTLKNDPRMGSMLHR